MAQSAASNDLRGLVKLSLVEPLELLFRHQESNLFHHPGHKRSHFQTFTRISSVILALSPRV